MLKQAISTGHIIRLSGSTIDSIAVELSLEWDTTSLALKNKMESLLIHLGTHPKRIDQLLLELAEIARRKQKLAGMRQELRQNGAPYHVYQCTSTETRVYTDVDIVRRSVQSP